MTPRRPRREAPRVRLAWDENLSVRVPRALRELGFHTTWIGDAGAPARGSSDAEVIRFAGRTNQVIVTSNHDMMTLCDEVGQRFVWLDPRGRRLTSEAQVVLVFQQIAQWERILAADPLACVHARRTGCRPIASAEAARLASNRMREIRRRAGRAPRAPGGEDPDQQHL